MPGAPRFAPFVTARLNLPHARSVDPETLVAVFNDFEVLRWLTRPPCPYTRADADDFLARQSADPGPVWAICDADGFAGMISLDNGLGYWLGRHAWGRGYMTEACRAVLEHHFADPGAADVTSSVFDGNAASARVLAKLGFQDEGACTLTSVPLGRDMPGRKLRLTRADWRAVRP